MDDILSNDEWDSFWRHLHARFRSGDDKLLKTSIWRDVNEEAPSQVDKGWQSNRGWQYEPGLRLLTVKAKAGVAGSGKDH